MAPKQSRGDAYPTRSLEDELRRAVATRPVRPQPRRHPMDSLSAITKAPVAIAVVPLPLSEHRVSRPVGLPRPRHPMDSFAPVWPKSSLVVPSRITHGTVSTQASSSSSSAPPSSRTGDLVKPSLRSVRKDAPHVKPTLRGDKRLGLEVAADPIRLDAAVADYKKGLRSAGDTTDAYIKTWTDFHSKVTWSRYGLSPPVPAVPLTPTKIMVVGSILRVS